MKNYQTYNNTISKLKNNNAFILIAFLLCNYISFAQVKADIDSTSIVIGSEIRYKMQVEADPSQIVIFPEGQTFTPLEVIDSYTIDTAKTGNRLSLIKEYALTQFDSGHYTIPRQKILVGDQVFYTDSLKVEIRDVLVDTTKQKMYEIKPLQEVDASFFNWKKYIWWILIPIILIGIVILVVLLATKKRKEKKEKELPPYEKAMLALQQIDNSDLLEQESHKEYYSKLSDTARKYIDEEIYDHAMESTTDELITKLDEEIRTGKLDLDKNVVEELKTVLKTADMAKFAKSKPDKLTAKADRNVIEKVIHQTKAAIPELTEEELLADEEYRETVAKKKRNKAILFGGLGCFAIIGITLFVFIMIKGFDVVKDALLGHPTKELAEAEWITSAYGSPPVTVTTPKVLIRNNFNLSEEQKQIMKGNETFVYGSLIGNFYAVVSTIQYQQPTEVDLEKVVNSVATTFESMGGKNITVKDEEYETLEGAKGIKVFGNLDVKNTVNQKIQKNDYVMLNFAENGGFQQITLVYDSTDRYAKDVAERIINSVELKSGK